MVVVSNGDVAERKRPEERPARLVFEYYGPEEEHLILRMRMAALKGGLPAREWVLQAIRERLAREEPEGQAGDAGAGH